MLKLCRESSAHLSFCSTDVINGVFQLSLGLFMPLFVTHNILDATVEILTKRCRATRVIALSQHLHNHHG